MKTKATMIIFVGIFAIVSLFPGSAYAEKAWYTCRIARAGIAADGNVRVCLTDNKAKFKKMWCRAVDSQKREVLAIALAALANNFFILVYMDKSEKPEPIIYGIYNK